MKLMAALCGLLLASSAWAMPDVMVSGVKMPAWVVRGDERLPLAPDMELRSDDVLITGPGARALLTSVDGSAIKLGENARIQLAGMAQHRADEPMFTALLDVAKGAFRFTTSTLGKLRKREVMVKVAGATVGIRGTDVWGKVGGSMKVADMEKAMMGKPMEGHDKDEKLAFNVVCLIEGQIEVAHGSAEAFTMNEPMTFYVMPKDEQPMAVTELSREQLDKWALETEIVAGQGAVRSGGRWKVNLLEVEDEAAALSAHEQMRFSGYDARVQLLAAGKFSLHILHLPSREEALALAQELIGKMGVQSPTVSR